MEQSVEEIAALLSRNTHTIMPQNGLLEKLRLGRPLRVKLGVDPTAKDIHLGFAVVLRKLREFQDFGHKAVLIIGDITAMVGDPTGRNSTRPQLTAEEIIENEDSYLIQVQKILDMSDGKIEIWHNSTWFKKNVIPNKFPNDPVFTIENLISQLQTFTVAQMLQRDDFKKRFESKEPIHLHELIYPILQGWDSLIIDADVELGGQDQIFNIMAGRDIQQSQGKEQQIAMTMPLLVGTDGVRKMSKSYGNFVGITEDPDVQFAKIMSIPDGIMRDWWKLCLGVADDTIDKFERDKPHPMQRKKALARHIVANLAGDSSLQVGVKAEKNWESIHELHLTSDNPREFQLEGSEISLAELMVATRVADSKGAAKRLIEQGGVSLNGQRCTDTHVKFFTIDLHDKVLQVGKRHFVKFT